MCGIVGGISTKNILPHLINGLERLEYRGYDSAGIALVNGSIERVRSTGRVATIKNKIHQGDLQGLLGIGHTRWATHGGVTEQNAHPHVSNNEIAVVHNGIIENHSEQCEKLKKLGYKFESETDTEVIAHLIHYFYKKEKNILHATTLATKELRGAFAIGVVSLNHPDKLVCARKGCPLIVGVGNGENFIASDVTALLAITKKIIYLEDGDIVELTIDNFQIYDSKLKEVSREVHNSKVNLESMELGPHDHFMQKEIYEQPRAIADTIEAVIDKNNV